MILGYIQRKFWGFKGNFSFFSSAFISHISNLLWVICEEINRKKFEIRECGTVEKEYRNTLSWLNTILSTLKHHWVQIETPLGSTKPVKRWSGRHFYLFIQYSDSQKRIWYQTTAVILMVSHVLGVSPPSWRNAGNSVIFHGAVSIIYVITDLQ